MAQFVLLIRGHILMVDEDGRLAHRPREQA